MIDLVMVAAASGLAGFVDAVVGGGGLVLVPALFATVAVACQMPSEQFLQYIVDCERIMRSLHRSDSSP